MQRVEWIMLFLFPLMTVCIMIILMTSYGNGTMLAGYVGISLGMIVVDSVLFVLLSYISDRERKLFASAAADAGSGTLKNVSGTKCYQYISQKDIA